MITIVKLGGSYITDKNIPEKINYENLDKIARELKELNGSKIIIHGGGSFGHYNALKYGFENALGMSKTRLAMMRLSMAVAKKLEEYELNPIIFPGGSHFIIRIVADERVPTVVNDYPIQKAIHLGATPITFGDVTRELHRRGSKPTIISGDEIAYALTHRAFGQYSKVIMISNVPGILVRQGGPLIRRIDSISGYYIDVEGNRGHIDEIEFRDAKDATGGMKAKLHWALKIARNGVRVILSDSLKKAIRGEGTIIE